MSLVFCFILALTAGFSVFVLVRWWHHLPQDQSGAWATMFVGFVLALGFIALLVKP